MQWEIALRLFDQLLSRGFEPSHVTYDAVINACERSNKNDIVRYLCQDRHERQSRGTGVLDNVRAETKPRFSTAQMSSFSREERTSRKPTYEETLEKTRSKRIDEEEDKLSLEQFLPMSGKTPAGLKQVKQTNKVLAEADNILDFAFSGMAGAGSRKMSPPRARSLARTV